MHRTQHASNPTQSLTPLSSHTTPHFTSISEMQCCQVHAHQRPHKPILVAQGVLVLSVRFLQPVEVDVSCLINRQLCRVCRFESCQSDRHAPLRTAHATKPRAHARRLHRRASPPRCARLHALHSGGSRSNTKHFWSQSGACRTLELKV